MYDKSCRNGKEKQLKTSFVLLQELRKELGIPVMELELSAWCNRGCRDDSCL